LPDSWKLTVCFLNRISEEEVIVSRLLEKALKRSQAVDTEGLCIIAGEQVS
jgi:exosome complex component RRP45